MTSGLFIVTGAWMPSCLVAKKRVRHDQKKQKAAQKRIYNEPFQAKTIRTMSKSTVLVATGMCWILNQNESIYGKKWCGFLINALVKWCK